MGGQKVSCELVEFPRTLQPELNEKPDLQVEMELFHGTRKTNLHEIDDGECGFDVAYCTSCLSGVGTQWRNQGGGGQMGNCPSHFLNCPL